MAHVRNAKKRETGELDSDTLEITNRSIRTTGIRTTTLVVVASIVLGFTYIVVHFGKTTESISVSGNNGTVIEQARDVTVNNGNKEDK